MLNYGKKFLIHLNSFKVSLPTKYTLSKYTLTKFKDNGFFSKYISVYSFNTLLSLCLSFFPS